MLKIRNILLASHGTPGARSAEKAALALCPRGSTLHHLVVVPDFWKDMMGDDWLNNAMTRETYGNYVEDQLEAEVRAQFKRLYKLAVKRGLRYQPEAVLGKPAEALLDRARRCKADLVVIGSPRPRGKAGFRSRMELDKLTRSLRIPLLIVPHPK